MLYTEKYSLIHGRYDILGNHTVITNAVGIAQTVPPQTSKPSQLFMATLAEPLHPLAKPKNRRAYRPTIALAQQITFDQEE